MTPTGGATDGKGREVFHGAVGSCGRLVREVESYSAAGDTRVGRGRRRGRRRMKGISAKRKDANYIFQTMGNCEFMDEYHYTNAVLA